MPSLRTTKSSAPAAPPMPQPQQPGTRTVDDNDAGTARPRKRRKRSVFSGAADDCFTCARRQVKCDRRRPYCSPCLGSGAACAGYKTTLTWGMGVASRGKLRGQFLPVSNAQDSVDKRESSSPTQPSAATKQQGQKLPDKPVVVSPSADTATSSNYFSTREDVSQRVSSDAHVTSTPSMSNDDKGCLLQPGLNPEERNGHRTAQRSQPDSQEPGSLPDSKQTRNGCSSQRTRMSLQPLVTSRDGPRSFPYIAQPTHSSLPGKTARIKYLLGYYSEVIAPVIVAFDSPTNPYRTNILELAERSEALQHAVSALSLSNLRQRRNRGLSTGKTLPCRRSCQAHCRMTDASNEEFGAVSPDEQMKEETFHKVMAFKSVNAQLADAVQRQDDALLATLLILCLFHMCDTGVAAFQAQFAGVKKLLALRQSKRRTRSDATTWITRMFTWFDTMTASINDRESQMNGRYLDIAATTSDEEWTLENLTGCDAGLFKLVAQLGRLTMLSQLKPVDADGPVNTPVPTAAVPAFLLHYHPTSHPTYPDGSHVPLPSPNGMSQSSTAFWREWQAIRQQLESWRLGMGVASPIPSTSSSSSSCSSIPSTPTPPPTSTFSSLCTSHTTSASIKPTSLSHVHTTNVTDLSNISEAFRYSALLYLERLAHPHLPSTHPRIQAIVYASLHYITSVQSDVFLLWPLFVTGAECTSETDRAVVRERCADIQKDSGFVNNLSCLELLERIWVGEELNGLDVSAGNGGGDRSPPGGASFRWQRVLDAERPGGEYIVV